VGQRNSHPSHYLVFRRTPFPASFAITTTVVFVVILRRRRRTCCCPCRCLFFCLFFCLSFCLSSRRDLLWPLPLSVLLRPSSDAVISTVAQRSGETPAFRLCCCLFSSTNQKRSGAHPLQHLAKGGLYKPNPALLHLLVTHCSLLLAGCWFTNRLGLTPNPSHSYPAFIPVPVSPLPSSAPSAHLRALRVRPCFSSALNPQCLRPNSTPQTIFHAFTQQNRMSSPQTHQKTNNSNSINKIKLSSKRFLVIVNPVQLN
jgi:hypothetical protein